MHPAEAGVGLNRYGYGFGDPINGFDRSGLGKEGTRGDGVGVCERMPWSCSAAQLGGGWGGMGGPGPGSMSSSELADAYGGLPPVMVGEHNYIYPSANPERSAHDHGGGWAYNPHTGLALYVPGPQGAYEPIYGPQVAAAVYLAGLGPPQKPAPGATLLERVAYAIQLLTWQSALTPGVSVVSVPEQITAKALTTFLGQAAGPSIVVPKGAAGPLATQSGRGFMYVGGSTGANGQVWGVRVMDATSLYPNGYVSYFNNANQAVNPMTGMTIARSDPWWHLRLGGRR
jgi:hypothetical protein